MNTRRNAIGVRNRAQEVADFGEIQSLPEVPREPKLRSQMRQEEVMVSLPPATAFGRTVDLLDPVLGKRLTVDNPVWSGDPTARLRALQKKLLERSLLMEGGGRMECLSAISLVERAVQLRLRWLQMQRSEAERHVIENKIEART